MIIISRDGDFHECVIEYKDVPYTSIHFCILPGFPLTGHRTPLQYLHSVSPQLLWFFRNNRQFFFFYRYK